MIKNSRNTFNNIIVAIVFGFIIFLIIGGWFYYNSLNKTTKEKSSEYLSSLALDRAAKVAGWFSDIEKKTQSIQLYQRKENTKKRKNAGKNDEALTNWLRTNADDFQAESASLYDDKKELVTKDKSAMINIPDELILDNSHAGERIIFGEVSFIMDRFYIGVVIPLYNEKENKIPSGYLSFNINLSENLFREVKPLPGNYRSEEILIMPGKRESYTLLIDLKEKKIIIPDLPDSDKDANRSIFQAVSDENKSVTGADQSGRQVNAYMAAIKGTNWFVIAKVDINEIEEPVIAERLKIVLFIAVVAVIFLLTAYFLIKPKRKVKPSVMEKSVSTTGPDAVVVVEEPEETEIAVESKNALLETKTEAEAPAHFQPEPAVDESKLEIEIPDEYKNVLLHVESKIEKNGFNPIHQNEDNTNEETLPALPETEVIEEAVIDAQPEQVEVELVAEEKEAVSETEPEISTEELPEQVEAEIAEEENETVSEAEPEILTEEITPKEEAKEETLPALPETEVIEEAVIDAQPEQVEAEIAEEEKETVSETEPEILTEEIPAQEEAKEETLPALPETEVIEEAVIDSQPEQVEAEIAEEEKETVSEAEPEILTEEIPAQEEAKEETLPALPETEVIEEAVIDPQPEQVEVVNTAKEKEIAQEVDAEVLIGDIPQHEEIEADVESEQILQESGIEKDKVNENNQKPLEAEAYPEHSEEAPTDEPEAEKSVDADSQVNGVETAAGNEDPIPATAATEENKEELSELEMIEGSLNDFMTEAKMTGYKKPGAEVLAKLEGIKSFGLIPKILFEINLILSKEPDNPQKLASVIIKEQGITTKILSVANSPYYGLQKKVTSIEYALLLLGRDEVCRLVTALSLSDAVRFPSTPNLKYLDYWFHSMVVGFTSRDIAEKLGFVNMLNEVFLGGIFHDLGIQILAKHFPKEFEEIVQKIKNGENSLDAEMDVLECTHQEIGRYAVEKWGLPADIFDALNCHHNPMLAEGNKILAGIINLSDWMTHQVTQNESFWEKGLDLETNNYKLLGFKSIETRNEFLEQYYPTLRATMQSVQF